MVTDKNINQYVSHSEFEQHVKNVSSAFGAVDRRFDELKNSLDHLSNKFDRKTQTSWPLLISGLGLVLSVVIAITALVWWGMAGRLDAFSNVLATHLEQPGHPESLRISAISQERITANTNAIEKLDETIHRELESTAIRLEKEMKLLDEHNTRVSDESNARISARLNTVEAQALEGGRWSKADRVREFDPLRKEINDATDKISYLYGLLNLSEKDIKK